MSTPSHRYFQIGNKVIKEASSQDCERCRCVDWYYTTRQIKWNYASSVTEEGKRIYHMAGNFGGDFILAHWQF